VSTIAEILIRSAAVLESAGIAEARRESSSLLGHAIGRDRTFLISHPEYQPTNEERRFFESFLQRRAKREPLQYITGRQEFYGLDFSVAPGVLIPRPETELIVENAVEFLRPLANPRFCEIGVGSGCISTAILSNVSSATALALDVSHAALCCAAANAHANGVASRLELRASDVLDALMPSETFDAIVSNPPYIPDAEIAGLQPEVRDFEPRTALTDGLDGLSIIRRIILDAPRFLRFEGVLLIEIGIGQASDVASMIDRSVWIDAIFLKDLQGIDRTLRAIRK
jgi:release factor glutamine methyltransferase